MECFDIAIIGGDKRLVHMVPRFLEQGYKVLCYATEKTSEYKKIKYAGSLREAVEHADVVAAGIPLIKENRIFSTGDYLDLRLQNFLDLLRKGQSLFAGVIPPDVQVHCQQHGVSWYDFMDCEPLAVFNAIATAEGAILEAVKNQPTNLHGSKTLIIGYGRCAKVLGTKLKALDAQVTVCCRNVEARGWAEAFGHRVISFDQLEQEISGFEYIYNTVPAVVLRENVVRKIRKDAIVLELASQGGGIDQEAALMEEIRIVRCPGLPGKYAAKVSGEKLAEFVIETLERQSKNRILESV